jgi:hypothetical protein
VLKLLKLLNCLALFTYKDYFVISESLSIVRWYFPIRFVLWLYISSSVHYSSICMLICQNIILSVTTGSCFKTFLMLYLSIQLKISWKMKLIVFCNVPPDYMVDMSPCFMGNSFLFLQDIRVNLVGQKWYRPVAPKVCSADPWIYSCNGYFQVYLFFN